MFLQLSTVVRSKALPTYSTSDEDSFLFDHDLNSYAFFDVGGVPVPQHVVDKVAKAFQAVVDAIEQQTDAMMSCTEDVPLSSIMARTLETMVRACSRDTVDLVRWMIDLRVRTFFGGRTWAFRSTAAPWNHACCSGFWHGTEQHWQSHCCLILSVGECLPIFFCCCCICSWEGWFAASSENISSFWATEELPLHGGHRIMVRGHRDIVNELAEGLDIRLNDPVTLIARIDGKGCVTLSVCAVDFLHGIGDTSLPDPFA